MPVQSIETVDLVECGGEAIAKLTVLERSVGPHKEAQQQKNLCTYCMSSFTCRSTCRQGTFSYPAH